MPSTDMSVFGTRLYSRFSAIWIKPRINKADVSGNNGVRDITRSVIQRSPGQTSDLHQFLDENGNLLAGFDNNGNLYKGGVSAVKSGVVQVVLSAAQITTLHSVPVSLLAAPGAGKVILPEGLLFQFKYGTVQFTGGGAVNPVYHGATTNLLTGSVAAATIQAAASATISAGAKASALALTTNAGVDLYAGTADFAAGDSTAIATLWYTIITLG